MNVQQDLQRLARRVEQTALDLEEAWHGDNVTDAQIEALANAVAAQSDAIAAIIRALATVEVRS